jgi:hypothetical protein
MRPGGPTRGDGLSGRGWKVDDGCGVFARDLSSIIYRLSSPALAAYEA